MVKELGPRPLLLVRDLILFFLLKLCQSLQICLSKNSKKKKKCAETTGFGSTVSHLSEWPCYSYLPLCKSELKVFRVILFFFFGVTTISISSQHVAAVNPFCLGLWIRSKQPIGQEKSSPGLTLGIKAEIWFKCLLIVFCLLTFPNLHCVLLLQEKIVTKIKLSGKVLLLFQRQSHGNLW